MLYLIWSLLNLGLVIYFLVICFKAIKLVREKIGLFAAVFFVLGLLTFIGQSAKDNYSKEQNSNQLNSWTFASVDSLKQYSISSLEIDLEKDLISKKYLGIIYGKDGQGQLNIPIRANSATTGLICGIIWKPISVVVNRTDDNNKFDYIVVGIVDWKLLGATIYTQSKRFDGIVSTEKASR